MRCLESCHEILVSFVRAGNKLHGSAPHYMALFRVLWLQTAIVRRWHASNLRSIKCYVCICDKGFPMNYERNVTLWSRSLGILLWNKKLHRNETHRHYCRSLRFIVTMLNMTMQLVGSDTNKHSPLHDPRGSQQWFNRLAIWKSNRYLVIVMLKYR